MVDNLQDILLSGISGYHCYCLQKPFKLAYVSKNLCDMTGFAHAELLDCSSDGYEKLLHPEDIQSYKDFLESASYAEGAHTTHYRIVTKDGTTKYVCDTMTTKLDENNKMYGFSTLSDITYLKSECQALQIIDETLSCGVLKYTCNEQPKVTYINSKMKEILRFSDKESDKMSHLDFCMNNVYLMLPMEERRKFYHFLKQVYLKDKTIGGELSILRCDGTKARIYGFVTKHINDCGDEEFQSICIDISERYQFKKEMETDRYVCALAQVYDKIFEYDYSNSTVKYLHGNQSSSFGRIKNIPMLLQDATAHWLNNTVHENDRKRVHEFFDKHCRPQKSIKQTIPPQIKFRASASDGNMYTYAGIFLCIDESISLFCVRNITQEYETDQLRNENETLKSINENMHELVTQFTEGIVAFEIENGKVRPLYSSENVCSFFGYSQEKWSQMAQKSHSIKALVSHSSIINYNDVLKLLENGEAEFVYEDVQAKKSRRIKAICTKKHSDDPGARYVMLYNIDEKSSAYDIEISNRDEPQVYIRTFGYFDVFVNGVPIAFRNKKSKELLALLVDRKGGFVTSEEAISFLWEDESSNSVTLARYRKVALRLKNILEEYGISGIVESVDGKRRLVNEKISCDLYDYLTGAEQYKNLFKGSYLTNYSWGETTISELLGDYTSEM